jgi:predicted phage tail protein
MTHIQLHGILGREYGEFFTLSLGNTRNILHAIDANRRGFLKRVIELQKHGFLYDIIINKKRIEHGEEMEAMRNPETIDLVPAITGSGIVAGISTVITFLGTHAVIAAIVKAVIFAVIAYALMPTPEPEGALEIEAGASKTSLIFSNTVNTASQGAPLPLGYGRLKVGSQVIQATIKSFPQGQKTRDAFWGGREGDGGKLVTNKVSDRFNF